MDYIRIRRQSTVNGQQPSSLNDIKELLKEWIKLYPNSFAPDLEFKIFQLEDGDVVIQLHEDMSSLAVSLLVLYFENSQQPTAYITIDDAEVLLKQNEGKRAMVMGQQPTANSQQPIATSVRFILEDNYCLEYNFEKRARPVKDSDIIFKEEEINLPENFDTVRVGDVVKKEIDKVLEEEGLTPKKLLIYFLCGAIGLGIGFLIVYFMSK